MFQFLNKNSKRNNNYNGYYPKPMQPIYANNPYEMNIMDTELNELKRQINDLYQRVNRLESFLGVRDKETDVNSY